MTSIFVNFRNGDEPYAASLVYRALADLFGPEQVFRSTDSIRPGSVWPDAIWQALAKCEVFVPVIGPRWLTMTDAQGRQRLRLRHDWVRREIVRALEDGKLVIPVLVNGAARLSRQQLPPSLTELALRQSIVFDNRDIAGGLDRLVERVIERIPGLTRRPPSPAGREPSLVDLWNVPPAPPHTVGRDAALADVHALLAGSPDRVVVIHGGVGVGKSHLAAEFAHRHAGSYESVRWLHADRPELIATQWAALGHELGIAVADPGGALPASLAALRRRGPLLLILDGLEDPRILRTFLSVPSESAHVLITSRRSEWGLLPTVRHPLPVFTRAESIALLEKLLPGASLADLADVAAALGDIPLALCQAGAFLRAGPVSPAEYARLVVTRTRDVLQRGETFLYPDSLGAAWDLGLASLREASPLAGRLVELLAFACDRPMPIKMFTEPEAKLPEDLAGLRDPLVLDDAVRAIDRSGLISAAEGALHAHALFQTFVRQGLPAEGASRLQEGLRVMLGSLRRDDPRDADPVGRYAMLLPHAFAADLTASDDLGAQQLVLDLVQYLITQADAETALELARTAVDRRREADGPDAEPTLTAMHHAAQAYYSLGRYKESLALDRQVYDRRLARFGESDPRTMISAHHMAIAAWAARVEPDPADLAAVAERQRQVFGADHPMSLWSAHNLGLALRACGRVAEARRLNETNLEGFRKALGKDHPDTLRSAYAVGLDLMALDEPAMALGVHEDTYRRRQSTLGEDHPDTLRSGYALTVCMRSTGADECLPMARDVYERRHRVLGEHHLDTLRARMLLGSCLVEFGGPSSESDGRHHLQSAGAMIRDYARDR